jgi:hypothetical protein
MKNLEIQEELCKLFPAEVTITQELIDSSSVLEVNSCIGAHCVKQVMGTLSDKLGVKWVSIDGFIYKPAPFFEEPIARVESHIDGYHYNMIEAEPGDVVTLSLSEVGNEKHAFLLDTPSDKVYPPQRGIFSC